jgi:bacterial/archaeal transporter family protein
MQITWLAPTLLYVLAIAGLGITVKLAMRDMAWPDILPWIALSYAIISVVLVATGATKLSIGAGTPWAIACAVCGATGLIALFVALEHGTVTTVVPVSAAYPIVSAIFAVIVLSEQVTVAKVAGIFLVVVGVIMVTLSP